LCYDLHAVTETIAQWTARQDPALRPVVDAIRPLVKRVLPHFAEYVDRSGVIRYGRTTAARDCLVYLTGHRDHVNLGFFHGADLPDPTGILEGTGKQIRHITLRTVADARRPAVRAVLHALAQRERKGAGST
jgi:hypothetical protein